MSIGEDLSAVPADEGDPSDYTGLWEYPDENLWLRIYEDATWEFVNDQEDVIEYGTLWADEWCDAALDGSGDTLQLNRSVSGDFINSVNQVYAFPGGE